MTELVETGLLSLPDLVLRMSAMPARIFNLPGGTLAPGAAADVVVARSGGAWTVDPAEFFSRSRNTPFAGRRLTGRADVTIVRGQVVFRLEAEPPDDLVEVDPGWLSTGPASRPSRFAGRSTDDVPSPTRGCRRPDARRRGAGRRRRAVHPGHDAVLLANHGALTWGPDLRVARIRMESLEHGARILLAARTLGTVTRLTREQIDALQRLRGTARYGQLPGY